MTWFGRLQRASRNALFGLLGLFGRIKTRLAGLADYVGAPHQGESDACCRGILLQICILEQEGFLENLEGKKLV